jgi:probable F420-dependent oxidoreductase
MSGPMRIGVQLPQSEMGADPGELRELVQGIRDLGFHHVSVLDHVVGADRAVYGDRDYLPYDASSAIHEPLVLLGFIAACAPELHLLTSILVLPQRQTALVAKQMAEVDILARGQTRLGVSLGWNDVEYEALGMSFKTRRRRLEEQVGLLRRLWTEPVVTFDGEFDRMPAIGISPPPVQRPIPIWFGGKVEAARRRAAVLGDGLVLQWPLPNSPLESEWPSLFDEMRGWRSAAGHSTPMGFEARIVADLGRSPEDWYETARQWEQLGATHVGVRTLQLGLETVGAHLARLALVREALGDLMPT